MMIDVLVARADRLDVIAFAARGSAASGIPSRNECPRARGPARSRSRGTVDPPASTIASKSRVSSLRIHVDADVAAGPEGDAFLVAHQRQAALEPALLELELRNAVAEQAADAIGALEHR